MKRRHLIWLAVIALMVSLQIMFTSCAGSKPSEKTEGDQVATEQQDDYGEIEQLLGITEADKQEAQEPQPDDELLQLLQANEQKSAIPEVEKKPAHEPAETPELEVKVKELQKELKEKDKTISVLKAQMMAQEAEKPKQAAGGASLSFSSPNISDQEYRSRYQQAYDLVQQRKYRDAISVFESLLAASTKHSLSDNAQYWIGECYYALGDYRAAILAFEKVFTYKNSNKNDYAQFKLGQCYYRLKDRQRAKEEFQSLIDNYKNSSLIKKAEQYLAKL